jgi:glucose/arabinose dehydrogenase
MKRVGFGILILLILVVGYAGWFAYNNLRGVGPALREPSADIVAEFETARLLEAPFPITLPENFAIGIYAKNLPGARVLALGPGGNFWVSQTSEGKISSLTMENDTVVGSETFLDGLNGPHGIVFDYTDPSMLYYAEETKVSRIRVDDPNAVPEKLVDLPGGGGHATRTILFGPDDRLYISIGSSCNVCVETDERRAAIYSMNRDGSDFKLFASGLRNSVFFTWSDVDGSMWATDMGRDLLGDDLPPDEINVIEEGKFYGWPYCYGNNVADRSGGGTEEICAGAESARVEFQAHSSPLGLAFIPEEGWPEEYWYDLIVAFHGSWNRSVPTGYKLVRVKLDAQGTVEGIEDFATGWLTSQGALGRPVDVMIFEGGSMFVTDDKAGVIYRIQYDRELP